MRRISQPFLQRLTAFGSETIATESAASKAIVSDVKAAGLQCKSSRGFSSTKFAQSAATEAKVNSVPPYVIYGAVGALGLGGLTYYMSSQPADSALSPVLTKQQVPVTPSDASEYGTFHVLDHMGMHFTEKSLLGNFAVLFFGSIDHEGRRKRLLQMAEAVMESDRKSNMHYLIPVFATLTPEKDDVIKMSAMVEDYATALNRKDVLHVRLKGITGEDNLKLHEAAQSYTTKVKAKKGASSSESATSNDEGDLYFVNPEGEFIASYGPDADPKVVGREWAEIMKAYKISHPSWMGPKAVTTRHA